MTGARKTRWKEDDKLDDILERSSLQVDVVKKAPELVVHERMSQGAKGKCTMKKVEGWSTEEMKDKANSLLEVDTEEMRKWRGMSREEMDQCWKNLAEQKWRLTFWTGARSSTVKERPS